MTQSMQPIGYPHIEQALRDGYQLNGLRSGGGLRIVTLTKQGETKEAYGEHPHFDEALQHCEEDFAAGGRPYREVYGGLYPHYLTGSQTASSPIDAWLLRGGSLTCWYRQDVLLCSLMGSEHYKMPDYIKEQTMSRPGVPVQWEERGITYEGVYELHAAPSGESFHSMKVVSTPDKNDPYIYPIVKTGSGSTIQAAFADALVAPVIEVMQ